MAVDFYKELEVSRKATADEIRQAYRKLALQYHPDKNPGNGAAEARFKAINRAHDVLSDANKRALYDEFGEAGLREGFNANAARAYRGGGRGGFGGGLEDLFGGRAGIGGLGDLFGDVFRQRGPGKPQDTAAEVEVDFAAALRGTSLQVSVAGVGDVTVRVPPGADDGDRLRVAAAGQAGRNGARGDLVLTLRVRPHECFTRDGVDLKLDVPISALEAYQGAKIRVPTPDGDVTLKVPPRAQSGQVVRLKGKGVRRQEKVGDLFVRFMVLLPTSDAPEVQAAIETLALATDLAARDKLHL